MRERMKPLGTRNSIGIKITELRKQKNWNQEILLAKMQVFGVKINASSLSKLDGQARAVTEDELRALSAIFNISIDDLLK